MRIARTEHLNPSERRYSPTIDSDSRNTENDVGTADTQLSSSMTRVGEQRRKVERLLQEQIHNALFGNLGNQPKLGRYVYLKLLGEGGMGVVCAAYDPKLDRKVAIKLIRSSVVEKPESRARMLREAQAMARLSHPNVVQVYEITEIEDEVCVVMEYIDGQTAREWVEQEERPWRDIVECYVQIATGLAAAHAEGIVHRDVKPENAIVDSDGRVRVLDFGIAQTDERLDAHDTPPEEAATIDVHAPLRTRTGALLGTPAYMSPEHVEGRRIDAHSDQFSLCASLYEALYGHRPFRGDTLNELVSSLLGGAIEPPPPRTTAPTWVHDIVVRGLARDPMNRWPSVDALAHALRDDPAARRRQHLWIGGGIAIATSALFAGWMAYAGSVEARAAQMRAAASEAQARVVEAKSQAALRESYLGSLNHSGYVELQTLDNPLRALVLLNEVYRDRPDDLHLRELLAVAVRPVDAFEWSVSHKREVQRLAMSRDGALAASADGLDVRVWDAVSGRPIATIDGVNKPMGDLKFSPDGQRLVAASFEGDVWSWAPRTGEELTHVAGSTDYAYVPISPDATRVARNVEGLSGLEIVDVTRGEIVSTLPETSAFAMAWSAENSKLAVRTRTAYEVWDVPTNTLVSTHTFKGGAFGRSMNHGRNAMMFDDGVASFVHVHDERVYVRDTGGSELVLEGDVVDSLIENSASAYQFLFDPDGGWIAVAGLDGHLDLWELPSGKRRFRVKHGGVAFNGIALSTDGERVATASVDGVVRVVEVASGALLARFDGHNGGVSAVAFSPSGDGLLSGSSHGSVYRWSADAQGLVARFDGALLGVRSDASSIVTRDGSGAVSLMEFGGEGGEVKQIDTRGPGQALAASFSPDGAQVAITIERDNDTAVALHSAADGEFRGEVPLSMKGLARSLAWSEDGSLLLVSPNRTRSDLVAVDVERRAIAKRINVSGVLIRPSVPGGSGRLVFDEISFAPPQSVLHIWDTNTWEEVAARPGSFNSSMHGVNHAHTVVARTGLENDPELLDLKTGRVLHTLRDEAGPLPPLVYGELYRFSHDDSLVASAHVDGAIRLWSITDGALHATLRGHGSIVNGFSLDGAGPRLVSSSADGTAIVWDTETGERIVTLDPASVALSNVSFMPDGAHVIADGADNRTHVWHVETGRLITRVTGTTPTANEWLIQADDRLLTWDNARGLGYLWDRSPETRSAEELDALIATRVPWVLDRGELRPR